jgi:hypothetical protein
MTTRQGADKARSKPLYCVAASLAVPFAGSEIGVCLFGMQALEGDDAVAKAMPDCAIRCYQRDRRQYMMATAREQIKALPRSVRILCLWQYAPPAGHNGIASKHQRAGVAH